MYIKTGMQTQPGRGRIDNLPSCLVDVKDRPYIINSIEEKLFEVVFLNKNDFYENIDPLIQQTKETISDCFLEEKFRHNIFIELFENIHKHAYSNLISKFSLKKEEDQYTVELSNFCEEQDFQKLISFLSVNDMSYEEMKAAYKKQILDGKMSKKCGAGLGILTIAKYIKKHSEDKKFNIIEVKNVGSKENTRINDEGQEEIIDLVDARLIINVPFPKKANTTNIQDDDYID